MAAIVPDPRRIKSFRTEAELEQWLSANHQREPELWLKVYKKDSGRPTVTTAQALDVMLCWGWIDAIRKSFDEEAFLQRYTPRRAKSIWSQINRDHIARLTAAGRMTPHGQRQVDAAKADGRWDAAYGPQREATPETLPADLQSAIEANPRALKTFQTLSKQNLFALVFRTASMKTAEGRTRKIAALVEMLARGETPWPQGSKQQAGAAKKKAARPVERGGARKAAKTVRPKVSTSRSTAKVSKPKARKRASTRSQR